MTQSAYLVTKHLNFILCDRLVIIQLVDMLIEGLNLIHGQNGCHLRCDTRFCFVKIFHVLARAFETDC